MKNRPKLTGRQVRRAQTSVILIGISLFGLNLTFNTEAATTANSGPQLMAVCIGGGLMAAWIIARYHNKSND